MAITHTPSTTITVEPLSPTIGAELSGVDLRQPQSDAQLAEIRQALLGQSPVTIFLVSVGA